MTTEAVPEFRPRRLDGKVAIVSGGGSGGPGVGNGKAMAVLFAQNGARVVIGDADPAAADETARLIAEAGGDAIAVIADVTNAERCEALVESAVRNYGRLDILVNNVGITGPSKTVVDVTEEEWNRVFAVNVTSMMLTSKYAIPAMIDGGVILNTASVGAIRWTERTAYAASKGAVISLTTALAGQHASQGIRVNAILPGGVWTPLVQGEAIAAAVDAEGVERVRLQRRRQALLDVEGTAWDIGYGALYLVSDEARWVTGQALVIDGGATIGRRIDHANIDQTTTKVG